MGDRFLEADDHEGWALGVEVVLETVEIGLIRARNGNCLCGAELLVFDDELDGALLSVALECHEGLENLVANANNCGVSHVK